MVPEGLGTALKPATEFWFIAQKPFRGTFGQNALINGVGYLNIDACRANGRWPSNLCLSHGLGCTPESCSESCPVRLMGEQSGESSSRREVLNGYSGRKRHEGWDRESHENYKPYEAGHSDSGTAARFFPCFDHDPFIYAAKASRKDRNEGCEGMEEKPANETHGFSTLPDLRMDREQIRNPRQNHHPTVKSVHLMRWLCRLACPAGGTILDPFTGSGSTGKAAVLEGFGFVGIERDPEYYAIAEKRIDAAREKTCLFDRGTDAIPA